MGGNTEYHKDQEWIRIEPEAELGAMIEEETSNETNCDINLEDSGSEEELSFLNVFDSSIRNGIVGDVVEYIGGYIIKKLKDCDDVPGRSRWIKLVSNGGLKIPSTELVMHLRELEEVFNNRMGKLVDDGPKVTKRLKDDSRHVNVCDKIKDIYFKCRIRAKINNLNEIYLSNQWKSVKKLKKKLKKTITYYWSFITVIIPPLQP